MSLPRLTFSRAKMTAKEAFEQLNLDLIAARKAVKERERILSLLDAIDRELAAKRSALADWEGELRLEREDVQVLERLSLTAVITKLLGQYEERLEKEVAEYLDVKMRVEALRITIDSLQRHQTFLEEMLVGLADCDEELAALQEQQEAHLVKADSIFKKNLLRTSEQIGRAQSLLIELDEALSIGDEIVTDLREVIDVINSGGGIFGIGRAVSKATPIQQTLFVYQEELRDMEEQLHWKLDLNIPSLKTVMTAHPQGHARRRVSAGERERRWIISAWRDDDLLPITNRIAKNRHICATK